MEIAGQYLAALDAIREFAIPLRDIGTRTSSAAWASMEAIMTWLQLEIEQLPPDLPPLASPGPLFDSVDSMEKIESDLRDALNIVRNPDILSRATAAMSLSFDEKIKMTLRNIETILDAARAARATIVSDCIHRIKTTKLVPTEIIAAYKSHPRAVGATKIFLAVLTSGKDSDTSILDDIKASSLGAYEIIRTDPLHPIQSMGIMFGHAQDIGPEERLKDAETEPVSLVLPGATHATTYNISPLINRSAAEKFGPIATTLQGLNYKLVQRLKTMTEVKIVDPSRIVSPSRIVDPSRIVSTRSHDSPHCITGPLLITMDNVHVAAVTVDKLSKPIDWNPLAGIVPYVDAYHRCAIRALARPQSFVDSPRPEHSTLDRYMDGGQSTLENKLQSDPSVLVRELRTAFERDYHLQFANGGPSDIVEFLTAVMPWETPPPLLKGSRAAASDSATLMKSYVTRAISNAIQGSLDHAILRPMLSSGRPHALQYDIARTESALTALIHITAAATSISRRIRDIISTDPPKREIFSIDGKVARDRQLIAYFNTIAQSISTDLAILKPTLKLFTLQA